MSTRMPYSTKTKRAMRRMNSKDPVREPCSSCGRAGVHWTRVREISTDQLGWRWRCCFCRASRFIPAGDQ